MDVWFILLILITTPYIILVAVSLSASGGPKETVARSAARKQLGLLCGYTATGRDIIQC